MFTKNNGGEYVAPCWGLGVDLYIYCTSCVTVVGRALGLFRFIVRWMADRTYPWVNCSSQGLTVHTVHAELPELFTDMFYSLLLALYDLSCPCALKPET